MAYIPVASWSQYDIGDPRNVSRGTLEEAVRRAAKTANSRLLRLERKGRTKGAYAMAMQNLGDRKRFKENPKSLTIQQLRREYVSLRDFISAKTSTIQGQNAADELRYAKAVRAGYQGTMDEFIRDIEKVFTESFESLFSSNVIYQAITGGTVDVLSKVVERNKKTTTDRGRILLQYLKSKTAYLKHKR